MARKGKKSSSQSSSKRSPKTRRTKKAEDKRKCPYKREEVLSARLLKNITREAADSMNQTIWKNEEFVLLSEKVQEPVKIRKGYKIMRVLNEFTMWYERKCASGTNPPAWRPTPAVPNAGESWSNFTVRGVMASLNGPARYLAMAGEFYVEWPTMEYVPLILRKGTIEEIRLVSDQAFRDGKPSIAIFTKEYIYFLLTPDFFFEDQWRSVVPFWERFTEASNLYIPDLDHTEARPTWWHGRKSFRAYRRWKNQQATEDEPVIGEEDHSRDDPQSDDQDDDEHGLEEFLTLNRKHTYLFSDSEDDEEDVDIGESQSKAKAKNDDDDEDEDKEEDGTEKDESESEGVADRKEKDKDEDAEAPKKRKVKGKGKEKDTGEGEGEKRPKRSVTGKGPPKRLPVSSSPVAKALTVRGSKRKAANVTSGRSVRLRPESSDNELLPLSSQETHSDDTMGIEISPPEIFRASAASGDFDSTAHTPPIQPFSAPSLNPRVSDMSFTDMLLHTTPNLPPPHVPRIEHVNRVFGGMNLGQASSIFPPNGGGWDSTSRMDGGNSAMFDLDSDYQPADFTFIDASQPPVPFQPPVHSYTNLEGGFNYNMMNEVQSALQQNAGDSTHPFNEASPDDAHFPSS